MHKKNKEIKITLTKTEYENLCAYARKQGENPERCAGRLIREHTEKKPKYSPPPEDPFTW